jgi:hypothetical protein
MELTPDQIQETLSRLLRLVALDHIEIRSLRKALTDSKALSQEAFEAERAVRLKQGANFLSVLSQGNPRDLAQVMLKDFESL